MSKIKTAVGVSLRRLKAVWTEPARLELAVNRSRTLIPVK